MKSHYFSLSLIIVAVSFVSFNLYAQNPQVTDTISLNKANWTKPDYQPIDNNDILEMFKMQPSFGIYRDNYIITGVPTNKKVNNSNADIKFQVSIRQLLLKKLLPRNHTLALTYTQKSFWDIYKKSSPFAENNYNPGLVTTKPITHNGTLRGVAAFAFEHESNGKDSLDNRSCNYFVLSGVYFFNSLFSAQIKVWDGWLSDENKDLFSKYKGHGLVAINYRSRNDKIWCSAVIYPRDGFKSFNTQMEININPSRKTNQYLFLQWYNGYGESLLEYNQYTSMVRVGICLKPPSRSFY